MTGYVTEEINDNSMLIEKWNGILPHVIGGGAIPLIGLGDTPKKLTVIYWLRQCL
jgi:hypothetical protein